METTTFRPLFCRFYSPALNTRRNETMKKQGKLREEDQGIRAYVKYPAVVKYPAALMVKRPGEAPCTSYAEYYIKKKKKRFCI